MQTTITLVSTTAGDYEEIAGVGKILANNPLVTNNFFPGDLEKMTALHRAEVAGLVTIDIEYTAQELATSLLGPQQTVGAGAIRPNTFPTGGALTVDSTELAGGLVLLSAKLVATGASGTIVDTTLFTADALPDSLGPKWRVVDAWACVTTLVALGTLVVRTKAGGLGTLLATMGCAAADVNRATALGAAGASGQAVQATSGEGLFVRRDRSVVAEIFLLIRKEK